MNAPSKIIYHQKSRLLELRWEQPGGVSDGAGGAGDGTGGANDGTSGGTLGGTLSSEFLRVHSPSAEVRGHGRGQAVLQVGKKNVAITAIRPVGHYAVQLCFDDGHDTGIYSWDYLADLCHNQAALWDDYLRRLREANASRDPDVQVVRLGL